MAHSGRTMARWWVGALAAAFLGCGEALPLAPEIASDARDDAIVVLDGDGDVEAAAGEQTPSGASEEVWVSLPDIVRPEPPPTVPEHLQGRFVDLVEPISPWPPFEIFAGDTEAKKLPDVTYGIFVDLEGDGTTEVVLSGVGDGESTQRAIYRYEDTTQGLVAIDDPLPSLGGVVLAEDIDGDGFTDLLLVRLGEYVILWGDAAGTYGAESVLAPSEQLGDVERTAFQLMDLDNDGWMDLMVRGECGLLVLMRTGPRRFEPRPAILQGYETATPYAIGLHTPPEHPPLLLVMGHAECGFYVAFSQEDLDQEGYPLLGPVTVYESPNNDAQSGLEGLIGHAPMGSAVSDLNQDGALDLYISLNPDHAILDGTLSFPINAPKVESGLWAHRSDEGLPQLPWGVALLDLDRDGLDDVITAHGHDTSQFFGSDPNPGPQWLTAHWNAGGFRFAEATELLGLERRGGWRALAVGDLDGDHDPDLIVGGLGEAPRVYRNDIETPHRGMAITLSGRVSNRLGLGAQVVVTPSGSERPQRYLVGGMSSPKIFSTPTLYPGLGAAERAEVSVHWPSGINQVVSDLAADSHHHLVEPEVLTISPVSRRLPAGGEAVATLTVSPQSPATTVSLIITHGDGIPGEAIQGEDGVWTLSVAPPPSSGSARLEIRIDGEAMAIHPRLFWDEP